MRKLYAFNGVENIGRGNPHAIILTLDEEGARRWSNHQVAEIDADLGRYELGEWISLIDTETGDIWDVATAPCGLGCRCAAVAKRGGE